ncbi:MAG TPA: acetoacetate--CoA ligase, partial [Pseudonocardia sp.]
MNPPAEVLWSPAVDAREHTRIGHYLAWLEERRGLRFAGYDDLWAWSVSDLDGFWSSVWEYFEVRSATPYEGVLTRRAMPGASWFTGATLNYAEHMLRGATSAADDRPVIFARSQTRAPFELTGAQLADQVARIRTGLRRLGVGRGDRVAAYLPNVPETLAAMLATASLGAVWSSCAPEFGTRSVLDRLRQIEPTVLLAVDGYRFGAKPVDRRDQVTTIRRELPGLRATVLLPYLFPEAPVPEGCTPWDELTAEAGTLEFEPVPFDHPLYILYSSGTTGPPKAIVHGHGGVLLEHLKSDALHHDLGPGDVHFWFSTTGWVVWNLMVSALLTGSAVVTFDGDPGYPDPGALWRTVAETGTTVLGVSAAFALGCRRAGLTPGTEFDLSRLRAVLSTGSALPPEGFRWFYDAVGADLHVASTSGGTDVCGGFLGGSPLLPVRAGEIACRCLGCKVEAYDPAGRPVIGEQGELVVTEPMPSMPVGFWNDPGGERYRAAYFDHFPGVWQHGDL